MTYLLALQKAIAQTQPDDTTKYLGDEYLTGWTDVEFDLTYAIDLQSETAAKIHLSNWDLTYADTVEWDGNTQGYIDRIKKINYLLESYK